MVRTIFGTLKMEGRGIRILQGKYGPHASHSQRSAIQIDFGLLPDRTMITSMTCGLLPYQQTGMDRAVSIRSSACFDDSNIQA